MTSVGQNRKHRRNSRSCRYCTESSSKEDQMLRKIIAGTAVVGSLTLGTVGLAGAATPSPSGNSGGTQLSTLCAKLPQVQSLVTQWQSDVSGFVPKVQALGSQAKRGGL